MTNDPLYVQIRKYVLSLVEQGGQGDSLKLPSENQLCLRFHASRVAVRHALSELAEKGVITKIQGRGTYINRPPAETPLKTNSQALAGCIMPTLNAIGGMNTIASATACLRQRDMILALFNTAESTDMESKYIQTLTQIGAAGMIIASSGFNRYSSEMLRVALSGFPTVQYSWYLPGLELSYVGTDQRQGMYDAARYLADRGHSVIGFISTPLESNTSTTERYAGYLACMRDMGGPGFGGYPFFTSYRDPGCREALKRFLTDVKPTALIVESYYYSFHLKALFKELGIKPMQDIDLIVIGLTYQDMISFGDMTPGVVCASDTEIGRLLARELLDLIGGKKPGEHILVRPAVHEGEAARGLIEDYQRTLVVPSGVSLTI